MSVRLAPPSQDCPILADYIECAACAPSELCVPLWASEDASGRAIQESTFIREETLSFCVRDAVYQIH